MLRRSRRNRKSRNTSWAWILVVVIVVVGGWLLYASEKQYRQTHITELSSIHLDNLEFVENTSSDAQIKQYEGFMVAFDKQNKIPYWSSWELLGSETEGTIKRGQRFWQDTEITGCPTTDDYKYSGYDRGHLYPAVDAKWSNRTMTDCFALTNICPQAPKLNSGAWKTLEECSRRWARRDSALVIVAGPVLTATDREYIGEAKVRVPAAFFKVILAPYLEHPRAIGFVYPNEHSPGRMDEYAVTVDYVEELTGFDFFASLPDDIENVVEQQCDFKTWDK